MDTISAPAAWRSDQQSVVAALKNAAAATGSDFHYLLGTAMRESSLKPNARSSTSSAAGLFQFVDQTWLGLVKAHGAQYGLGSEADAIRKGGDGRYHASDSDRRSILALKTNPQLSALMAGEYAKTTQNVLKTALGREVCGGERQGQRRRRNDELARSVGRHHERQRIGHQVKELVWLPEIEGVQPGRLEAGVTDVTQQRDSGFVKSEVAHGRVPHEKEGES